MDIYFVTPAEYISKIKCLSKLTSWRIQPLRLGGRNHLKNLLVVKERSQAGVTHSHPSFRMPLQHQIDLQS